MLTTSFLYFMIIITLLSLLQRTTNKQEGHTLITKIPNYITIFIYIYKKKKEATSLRFNGRIDRDILRTKDVKQHEYVGKLVPWINLTLHMLYRRF